MEHNESDPSPPRRLRRLARIWAGNTRYFLTFCVDGRRPMLGNERVHERIRRFVAGSLERHGVWVDAYVLMPDHVHLIISTTAGSVSLGEWVKAFKAMASRREFKWQPGFFDHVLRSDESASEKWEYIRMNPVRAGLVEQAGDWKYSAFFDSRTGRNV